MKKNRGQKRKGARRLLARALAVLLLISCVAAFPQEINAASRRWNRVGSVCYNGKGKPIPRAITRGIDVSAWQGKIDWNKVKNAGVDFVFVRVGHGTHTVDTQFANNMKGAAQAGIPAGVYFYSTTTSTAQSLKDAQWVIQCLQGYKVSYPVVVDMESSTQLGLTNTQRTNIAKVFMEEVKRAGYYPMLYCNTHWYNDYLNAASLAGYDKWLASYGESLTAPPGVAASAYTVWQATSGDTASGLISTKGLIAGIPVFNDVDIDFGYKNYREVITPRTKANASYTAGERWVSDSKGKRYQLANGTYIKGKAKTIDGKKYYFKTDGYMATGWLKLNGKYYYMGSDGAMRTGWQQVSGKWYYLGTSGVMRTGLLKLENNIYLLNSNGAMLTGWQKYKTYWLYLGSDGAAKKSWQTINGQRYYFRQNGIMLTGLNKIGKNKYYFNSDGHLVTGWFQYTNGKKYYANSQGAILQNGWIQVAGKWYYLNPTGSMRTGWLTQGQNKYYLTVDGSMKVGWLKYKGRYYYFLGDGKMAKNVTLNIGGKNYKFAANGVRIA